ncbi:ribosomal L1 domain-containing protein 1 [Osmerus eperlanus]|uniref:ribosomal L1 domain-containing protein 1 n=1 Tax=Osmerus eperlanus TaxID=29151 RepID=UPI002E10CF54
MRLYGTHTREASGMAEKVEDVVLDQAQVKKAVQALQAFLKTTSTQDTLLEESHQFSLLFTLWKIPKQAQTIRIPLPHGLRSDVDEVCLFTRDEPKMTSDQTQRFYKKLLEERGVKNITEVIPYKVLKTEYKPYEAKRKLLGNFEMFLSDDRIRRLLTSHIGKHFYERKKDPLSVNLQSKHLARDIQRLIQGSTMKVSKKGSCCMARVAHSGMTTEEVTENIEATVSTVVNKLRLKGKGIKVIHLKSQSSVALPIYTSDLSHLTIIEDAQREARKAKKASSKLQRAKKQKTSTEKTEAEEEIPELVPIVTPSKKAKLQTPPQKKKVLEKAPKPPVGKKGQKAKAKMAKKKGTRPPSQKIKRKVVKS